MMKIQLKTKRAAIVASISLAILATSALAAEKHGHGADNISTSPQTPMQMGDLPAGMMDGGMSGGGMMDEGMMGGDMMGGDMMGGNMMSMMKNMHTKMHDSAGGSMMDGDMSGGGMMDGDNLSYDSDADGTTSVAELRDALQSELSGFDADSNGVLDIEEFEKLNAARIRNQMVDRFQALDEDGDGQVTQDEMTAPADKMQRRMDRQARSRSMSGMHGGSMQPSADDKE